MHPDSFVDIHPGIFRETKAALHKLPSFSSRTVHDQVFSKHRGRNQMQQMFFKNWIDTIQVAVGLLLCLVSLAKYLGQFSSAPSCYTYATTVSSPPTITALFLVVLYHKQDLPYGKLDERTQIRDVRMRHFH